MEPSAAPEPPNMRKNTERPGSLVSSVRPHTMIASGDTETCVDIVQESQNSSLPIEVSERSKEKANDGNNDDNSGVDPVDVLVPVLKSEWLFRNVFVVVFLVFSSRLGFSISRRSIHVVNKSGRLKFVSVVGMNTRGNSHGFLDANFFEIWLRHCCEMFLCGIVMNQLV